MYQTEYCEVSYLEKEKIVLLVWKNFCAGEEYRKPVRYALELFQKNANSNFLVDARTGFEDDEADVIWDFEEFIPNLAKTDCKKLAFITQKGALDGEIDMFTKEFQKYFEVIHVVSPEEGIAWLNLS